MRDILFRGKRTDDGEWMLGNLTLWGYGTASINETPAEGSPLYAVDPDSIGEFTGFTDMYGKRIFEGDIVAFYFFDKGTKNTRTMLIEWREGGFCMKELFRDYRLAKDFSIIMEKIYTYRGEIKQGVYTSNNTYFVEIIGNIHDNPELMKGG